MGRIETWNIRCVISIRHRVRELLYFSGIGIVADVITCFKKCFAHKCVAFHLKVIFCHLSSEDVITELPRGPEVCVRSGHAFQTCLMTH